VQPALIELKHLSELHGEVFGPVLHVLRYQRRDIAALVQQINATGYGLTMGVHSRIDETMDQVVALARAGNLYVNRNMVGAVVGVQPFGGAGLSGTGPKAGGPLYLYRLLAQGPADAMARAVAWADVPRAPDNRPQAMRGALLVLHDWAQAQDLKAVAQICRLYAARCCSHAVVTLCGPTGERNVYTLRARDAVLCLAQDDADRLVQLGAVLAAGSRAVWPSSADALRLRLPGSVRERIVSEADWTSPSARYDVVLHHGDAASLRAACVHMSERPGAIVAVHGLAHGDAAVPLERLVVERSLSVNTAAAGGNATRMSL
jgi:RHH-type proline utilization regulon transcriptional repressor/proline dehydrogenase/delta 1-pyrroline-5-carboxylate dehydrogenase